MHNRIFDDTQVAFKMKKNFHLYNAIFLWETNNYMYLYYVDGANFGGIVSWLSKKTIPASQIP